MPIGVADIAIGETDSISALNIKPGCLIGKQTEERDLL